MEPFTPAILLACLLFAVLSPGSAAAEVRQVPIAEGWAKTKVNCVIFRKNSLVSNGTNQFAAFYDSEGRAVLAKRELSAARWQIQTTPYRGNVKDAHNCISIALDGDGYLHMSWDHHGNPLRYCRSVAPGSLELTEKTAMVGTKESRVTYPEFYLLPGGDLLFLYRDGSSGNGDLVLNRYDVKQRKWIRVQDNLLGGEGQRNAYWQAAIDAFGAIHLSWVWRETGDVVTNHDIAYAKSADGGRTWRKSNGEICPLPITEATADYAVRIPQRSELANQTSMAADAKGRPYIANYWRAKPEEVPQYRIIYHDGNAWRILQVGERKLDFHRKGGGTKKSVISRPVLLLDASEKSTRAHILFRDQERGSKFSVATCGDFPAGPWHIQDLTPGSMGQADPTYDLALWAARKEVHLLAQFVGQGDGETMEEVPPQVVSVLEWKP